MVERSDEDLLRGAALEEEGIPELDEQEPGQILSGDTGEGIIPPREYALGAEEFGTTAGEEAIGESLDQRVAREEPDVSWHDVAGADDRALAGRLVQPDNTSQGVADAVPDGVALSAEEAAMRIETDPAGLGAGGPGYVDED
jgi:hypothetical protein